MMDSFMMDVFNPVKVPLWLYTGPHVDIALQFKCEMLCGNEACPPPLLQTQGMLPEQQACGKIQTDKSGGMKLRFTVTNSNLQIT